MQPAIRARLREVERETLEAFMAEFRPPPRGATHIHFKGLISHVKCVTAARFFTPKLGQRRLETAQKATLGANCASKTTNFTLRSLALSRPLDGLFTPAFNALFPS
jgi:hypothetical protein